MTLLITFKTSRFDVTRETPNESNPFAGQGLLHWLRAELARHAYESTEPAAEDWGWYIDVTGAGASYLVGATAEVEYKPEAAGSALAYDVAPDAVLDWTVQVHKQRKLKDKLFGKNRMAADDPLCALIERILRNDASLSEVSSVREAD